MKSKQVLAIVLSLAVLTGVAAGCGKKEPEEPMILYYNDEQGGDASVVTLASADAPAQTTNNDILAPIIADRSGTGSATVTAVTSGTSETSETSTAETAAAPAETQEGQAGQNTDVPDISGSYITDNAGVIGDEGSVNAAMSSFESNTGVSPAIFTIRDSLSGDDFRQYARDLYSSNFSDQNHVLVVYQLTPAGTWSWTCVFGSNTGNVFTQDAINSFQSDLTSAFSSSSVDSALVSTFNNAQSQN